MSQATPVSKIPRSVLSLGPSSGKRTPQPTTTAAIESAININVAPLLEENLPKTPKEKRRISNDSGKHRNSPRLQVEEKETVVEKKEKVKDTTNGVHVKETNGASNGNHANETTNGDSVKKETPKKKDEKKKLNGDKAQEKKDEIILAEKNDQEMESLVVESEPVDSPMPGKGKGRTPGRILTPRLKPPAAAGRVSPFKKAGDNKLDNVSTIVNLSTVSEQSTEPSSSNTSPAVDDTSPINKPPNRVSGRRSTRPIKDIQLTHYRNATLNESTSSTNATLGSPVHHDSLRTPITAQLIARKRKDGSPDFEGFDDTPSKRVRIDFSGMLSYVTTPVTLLKNGLSRINFTSSTPRKLEVETEETPVANVSGAENVVEEATKDDQMVDSAKDAALEIIEDDLKKSTTVDDDISIKETTNPNRSFCSIM